MKTISVYSIFVYSIVQMLKKTFENLKRNLKYCSKTSIELISCTYTSILTIKVQYYTNESSKRNIYLILSK